ncbi:MAG TPA: peptide chain release factor 2 [Patescibacteria group bacterium]|nr:peptide chain release factor 2 [Patescibacteria group bacterium]
MENLLKQLEDLRERFLRIKESLDIEGKRQEAQAEKNKMNWPDFWDDREEAVRVSKKVEDLDKEVEKWSQVEQEITDLEELVALAQEENDSSLEDEAHKKFRELYKKFRELEFYTLFSGEYDRNSAIISIHAGTGGVDAQDWAQLLERMYLRFIEKKGWQPTILDRVPGNEAGVKSVTIKVDGVWVFGYLRSEAGVHRLVRISPFDAEGMRHTSFALVEVVPELPEEKEIEVKEDDLRVDTFGASGPGGQSVNKTESAVRIVHVPTGITVSCQNEKSQHQNKETAMKILKSKLHAKQEQEKEKEKEEAKGEVQTAEWGKQIRSYVFQPHTMVKDHRTNYETSDVDGVMDGEIEPFIESYLKKDLEE